MSISEQTRKNYTELLFHELILSQGCTEPAAIAYAAALCRAQLGGEMLQVKVACSENLFKNARAETLFEKWPWRMLWQHNRCIIPVTGFFEPHRLPNGKAQYYYTTLKDQEIFSIAGLWDEWTNPQTGEKVLSFVLITTDANAMMRKIHNGGSNPFRMPKILTSEQERLWLDPTIASKEAVTDLLTVYPEEEMTAWPVRQKFNYGDPFDEGIIEPVAEQQNLGL